MLGISDCVVHKVVFASEVIDIVCFYRMQNSFNGVQSRIIDRRGRETLVEVRVVGGVYFEIGKGG